MMNQIVTKTRLSTRELEVLELILDEHTTSEIAEKLFLSMDTIKTYRSNLLQKLNARNAAGLVRRAFEYELIALG